MGSRQLAPELQPRLVNLELATPRRILNWAENELRSGARDDTDGCRGFYPSVEDTDRQMPNSQAFAAAWPTVEHTLNTREAARFDWIKFSQGKLPRGEGYHLDRNRASGLGASEHDSQLVPSQRIWRILANLHTADRDLAWLDVDPQQLKWREATGFTILDEEQEIGVEETKFLKIPRRCLAKNQLWAAVLCVSQVAHGARETSAGHFLASWSVEESPA